MRDGWMIERELERLRREQEQPVQEQPVQVPLELPIHEPYEDPSEASPDPEVERGVVVIQF